MFCPSGFPGEKPFKRLEYRNGPLKAAFSFRENQRLALFFVGIFTLFFKLWRETDRDVEAWPT
jgi:hypothetical protein